MKIDINCDLGEGFGSYRFGDDAALMKIISSANIACGFHAGDPSIMATTTRLASVEGVDIGAHVSFPDLQGFGRRQMQLDPSELEALTLYQLGALSAFAGVNFRKVSHITFHGALGSMVMADAAIAETVLRAAKSFDRSIIVIAPPMTELHKVAQRTGLPVANVIFADRAYDDKGLLVSRKLPGSVITNPKEVGERVLQMLNDRAIRSINGKTMPVDIHSVLVHGDTPGASALATLVRDRIESGGAVVAPVSSILAAH